MRTVFTNLAALAVGLVTASSAAARLPQEALSAPVAAPSAAVETVTLPRGSTPWFTTLTATDGRRAGAIVWAVSRSTASAMLVTSAQAISHADTGLMINTGSKRYPADQLRVVFPRTDVAFVLVQGKSADEWESAEYSQEQPALGEQVFALAVAPTSTSLVPNAGVAAHSPLVREAQLAQRGLLWEAQLPERTATGAALINQRGYLIGLTTAPSGSGTTKATPIAHINRLFEMWRGTQGCPILGWDELERADDTARNDLREWLAVDDEGRPHAGVLLQACQGLQAALRERQRGGANAEARFAIAADELNSTQSVVQHAYRASRWMQQRQSEAAALPQ